jgi:hypothetical protein
MINKSRCEPAIDPERLAVRLRRLAAGAGTEGQRLAAIEILERVKAFAELNLTSGPAPTELEGLQAACPEPILPPSARV